MRNTYKNILNFFNNNEAQFRLEVIKFFEEFSLKPTQKAFGVSKATLYRWRKRLNQSGGKLTSLIPLSKAPKRKRQMMVNPKIVDYIAFLREKHPCLGKRKIKPLLDKYCKKNSLNPISVSTIGKVIKRHNLFFKGGILRIKLRFNLSSKLFYEKLIEYLLFSNTKKVYESLGFKSPLDYLIEKGGMSKSL